MLDYFAIVSTTGAMLWDRRFDDQDGAIELQGDPVSGLVRDVLLQERSATSDHYDTEQHRVNWLRSAELQLVFVAVFSRAVAGRYSYFQELLRLARKAFSQAFSDQVKELGPAAGMGDFAEFGQLFDQALKRAQRANQPAKASASPAPIATPSALSAAAAGEGEEEGAPGMQRAGAATSPCPSPQPLARALSTRELARLKREQRGDASPGGRRNKKGGKQGGKQGGKKGGKKGRKWEGQKIDDGSLDFSPTVTASAPSKPVEEVKYDGKSTLHMKVDWDDDDEEEEEEAAAAAAGSGGATAGVTSWLQSVMQPLTGGTISAEQLVPIMKGLEERMVERNVTQTVARRVCEAVRGKLVGRAVPAFSAVKSLVREAMSDSIERILTPRRPVDVLAAATAKRDDQGGSGTPGKDPYVITFTGVNGVGKSTSLSKVVYYLQDHGLSVLIAACDTFRAGAVEQLRRHCTALKVPLFQRGYGKDTARIAGQAVAEAKANGIDVVCIDTAGRMQNNERYMRELATLVSTNSPDLVLFVGEALVGNDGVDQLAEFNRCLIDYAPPHSRRGIDGVFLTKFDTIDDKVGSALSMVHATGIPIVFLGVGQKYYDLKKVNAQAIVKALLA